ncbi:MAG: response regulator [Micropepsaceae bacterium]
MNAKITVCVADDDERLRHLYCKTLMGAGFLTVEAANGNQALRQIELTNPGVVVLDIVMPDSEGLGAIRELRKRFPATRILAISGGGMMGAESYLELALKLGAHDALQKPFPLEVLVSKVEALAASAETLRVGQSGTITRDD